MPTADASEPKAIRYFIQLVNGRAVQWVYINRQVGAMIGIKFSKTPLDATAFAYEELDYIATIIHASPHTHGHPRAIECNSAALLPPNMRKTINVA